MKKLILLVGILLFPLAEAYAGEFGLNAGVSGGTYKGGNGVTVTGQFALPVVGVNYVFRGKGLFSLRNYFEFTRYKLSSDLPDPLPDLNVTSDFVGLTVMPAIGRRFFGGLGLTAGRVVSSGGDIGLYGAVGVGYYFGRVFLEGRMTSELSPDSGSFLDNKLFAFQLGYRFGKGK